ncbi:MAG TPA: HesA/MoeB/ThiF family protein [Anseongella sp.]|nr:HesA/MoeB/ThiF family protein [Anseongella sp.]
MIRFSQQELKRYSRQMLLPELGQAGQEKLKKARVLVVGAGGLGCPALQYLAAAGLGTIGIIDGDEVEESNLHRQLLFSDQDTGRNKAEAAAEKLSLINPFVKTERFPFFLTAGNAEGTVAGFDLVIDGSDNFATRYLVNDACVISGKPFIYAAMHRFELQLSVFNLEGGPTYRCLYPEPPAAGEMPSCAEAGIIGALPGLAGTLQALEALKIITGSGQALSGKLLTVNCLTNERQLLDIFPCPASRNLKEILPLHAACTAGKIPQVTSEQLKGWISGQQAQLVDVRSRAEYEGFRLDQDELHIPLDQLPEKLHEIGPGKRIVTVCRSGIRSKAAAALIKAARPYQEVFSLKGGLASFLQP